MQAISLSAADRALPRYDFLDGLRAVLALYVVTHHCAMTALGYGGLGSSLTFGVLSYGDCAVYFFIVLSGFCLTLPTLKNDFRLIDGLGAFFRRRAWRILPPYYFALLLSLLLIATLLTQKNGSQWDACLPVTFRNLLTHLFLVQNFVMGDVHKINFVFWSIAVEWQIYFLFPLLLLGWRRAGPFAMTLAAVALSSLLEIIFRRRVGIGPEFNLIGLFALGMFAAQVSFSTHPAAVKYQSLPWRLAAILAGPVYLVMDRLPHEWVHFASIDMFGCFAGAVLIVASRHPQGWLRRLLDFRPLVFIGTFSYSLYLIHAPLIEILRRYLFASLEIHPNLLCVALLVFGAPVIVLVSYVFFLGAERTFLQRRKHPIVHLK